MITQDYLKSILHYCPDTGVFTWKHRSDVGKAWNTKWSGKTVGVLMNTGYFSISINNKKHLSHRLAWIYIYGVEPLRIDHINGVKTDNRICNLRDCSVSDNAKNMKRAKNNTSGRTGVYWDKVNLKWLVMAYSENKQHYAGRFINKEDAIAARIELEKRLNFHNNHDRTE
jgi:hypothetical protein